MAELLTHLTICPLCNADLDGGDIHEVLRKDNPSLPLSTIDSWAADFGWSLNNKERFDRAIHVTVLGDKTKNYWKCPDCNNKIKEVLNGI